MSSKVLVAQPVIPEEEEQEFKATLSYIVNQRAARVMSEKKRQTDRCTHVETDVQIDG